MQALSEARRLAPGVATALLVAAAAGFIADTYGGPVMLLALLLGLALNFLGEGERVAPGVRFTAKSVLKFGVALLGLGIAVDDVLALGLQTVAVVLAAMAATVAAALLLARLLRLAPAFGVLVGGATAICGASAALALAAVLPRGPGAERDTAFTVIAVTTLSTVAMLAYPVLAGLIGFDDRLTGILIGATIHDVAQVVGAGYAVSQEAGDTATIVKLFRVAMLVPVVLLVGLAFRASAEEGRRGLPLPLFLVGFLACVALNALGLVPEAVRAVLADVSRGALVAAVAAVGLGSSMREMARLGRPALVLSVSVTGVLLAVAAALIAATAV